MESIRLGIGQMEPAGGKGLTGQGVPQTLLKTHHQLLHFATEGQRKWSQLEEAPARLTAQMLMARANGI